MGIGLLILQSMNFFWPAYFANMAPVLVSKLRFLDYPIDFGRKFRGKRIFGNNKTVRGLVFGVIVGILIAVLQKYLFIYTEFFNSISLFDYTQANVYLLGFLLGFGALFGDLVKSFAKRQFNMKPGTSWPVFDQLDFVVFGLLFASTIYTTPLEVIICLIIISPLLHILSNILGYVLKIKKVWW